MTSEKADYDRVQLFLKRHPDISLRKSKGVSYARNQGMNKEEVNTYFDMFEKILCGNDLMEKPGNIFNIDEAELQLNNRPGHVVAEKGSEAVATSTSTE